MGFNSAFKGLKMSINNIIIVKVKVD